MPVLNVATRRVYNRMYVPNPPEDAIIIMADNGVMLYKASNGVLDTYKRWLYRCQTEWKKIERNQLRISLRNFYVVIDDKQNISELYMRIFDETGNTIDSLRIHQNGVMPPELQKAVRIIEGKDPFDPKPKLPKDWDAIPPVTKVN